MVCLKSLCCPFLLCGPNLPTQVLKFRWGAETQNQCLQPTNLVWTWGSELHTPSSCNPHNHPRRRGELQAPRPGWRDKPSRVPGPAWGRAQTHLPVKSGHPQGFLGELYLRFPRDLNTTPEGCRVGMWQMETLGIRLNQNPTGVPRALAGEPAETPVLSRQLQPSAAPWRTPPVVRAGGTAAGEGKMQEGDFCILLGEKGEETSKTGLASSEELSCLFGPTLFDCLQNGEGLFSHF